MFPATVHHTEAVFSIVREIYGRRHDDTMDDLDVSMAIWSIFLSATRQAAVHLGKVYKANLRYVKNHLWNNVKQLLNETGKLISGQTEITGVNTIDFEELRWMSTSLLCSQAYRFTNAKNLRLLRLLFDRINLDSQFQVRYIDTRHQLADMLTEGNFTRDEWNNLLCLFKISNFQLYKKVKK